MLEESFVPWCTLGEQGFETHRKSRLRAVWREAAAPMDGVVPVRRPDAILGPRPGRPAEHAGMESYPDTVTQLPEDARRIEQQFPGIEHGRWPAGSSQLLEQPPLLLEARVSQSRIWQPYDQ